MQSLYLGTEMEWRNLCLFFVEYAVYGGIHITAAQLRCGNFKQPRSDTAPLICTDRLNKYLNASF